MPDPLEYEEEDLFEEIGGPTDNRPIAGPSRQPISAVPSSVGNTYLDPRKARLQLLYAKRKHESEREKHQARVWDVGDLEYPVIREFLLGLPRDQLEEVENNSKHLKEDTDWLWEIFLLEDHPTQYERCNTKDGQPRTRGWRRMYRRIREEIEQRQENAKKNLADRYAKMEQERDAKRIQVIDRLVPDKRKRGRGGFTSSSSSTSASSNAPARSIIAKARSETNRARVALTHASGRYLPPVSGRRPIASPFSTSDHKHPSSTVSPSLSRIPPPRARHNGASSQADVEANRIAQASRAALPAHLKPRPSPAPAPHFRLATSQSKYQTVVKPQTAKFQPPRSTATTKARQNFADYFGDAGDAPKGLMASLTRANGDGGNRRASQDRLKRSADEALVSSSRKRSKP